MVKFVEFPEAKLEEVAVSVDWLNEMIPGDTVMVGKVLVMEDPPMVAEIVETVPEAVAVNVLE